MDERAKVIETYLEKGLDYFGQGQIDEARNFWTRVLQIDPSNQKAAEYLQYLGSENQRHLPRDLDSAPRVSSSSRLDASPNDDDNDDGSPWLSTESTATPHVPATNWRASELELELEGEPFASTGQGWDSNEQDSFLHPTKTPYPNEDDTLRKPSRDALYQSSASYPNLPPRSPSHDNFLDDFPQTPQPLPIPSKLSPSQQNIPLGNTPHTQYEQGADSFESTMLPYAPEPLTYQPHDDDSFDATMLPPTPPSYDNYAQEADPFDATMLPPTPPSYDDYSQEADPFDATMLPSTPPSHSPPQTSSSPYEDYSQEADPFGDTMLPSKPPPIRNSPPNNDLFDGTLLPHSSAYPHSEGSLSYPSTPQNPYEDYSQEADPFGDTFLPMSGAPLARSYYDIGPEPIPEPLTPPPSTRPAIIDPSQFLPEEQGDDTARHHPSSSDHLLSPQYNPPSHSNAPQYNPPSRSKPPRHYQTPQQQPPQYIPPSRANAPQYPPQYPPQPDELLPPQRNAPPHTPQRNDPPKQNINVRARLPKAPAPIIPPTPSAPPSIEQIMPTLIANAPQYPPQPHTDPTILEPTPLSSDSHDDLHTELSPRNTLNYSHSNPPQTKNKDNYQLPTWASEAFKKSLPPSQAQKSITKAAFAETSMAPNLGLSSIPQNQNPLDELNLLISGAEDLIQINDFSGATELIDACLAQKPGHPRALQLKQTCETQLLKLYTREFKQLDAKPRLLSSTQQLTKYQLDHRAGFLLSQLDGQTSVQDLIVITGFDEFEILTLLHDLLQKNLISI